MPGDASKTDTLQLEAERLQELQQDKEELLLRVQNLKKELSDWRQRLNTQVKTYQSEMGELRDSLTSEVNDLRSDFETLRSSLRQQIDATTTLAQGEIRRNANSADQVGPIAVSSPIKPIKQSARH